MPIVANLQAAQDAVVVTNANRGNSNFALGSIVCRSSLPGQAAFVVGKVTAAPGCVPLNSIGEGVASAAGIRYATGNNQDFENMTMNMDVFEASMQGKLPWSLPAGNVAVAFGFHYRKEAGRNCRHDDRRQWRLCGGQLRQLPLFEHQCAGGLPGNQRPAPEGHLCAVAWTSTPPGA